MPHEQALLLGDEEIIGGRNPTPVLSLMSMLGATTDAQVDILSEENADSYWQRSDQFDMGLILRRQRAPAALAEAMTRWISHLLGIDVAIEPLAELHNATLTWYVGLDSEATRSVTGFGKVKFSMTGARVACLRCSVSALPRLRSWLTRSRASRSNLILAMTPDQGVRMKPQNLLRGLPVKHLEAAVEPRCDTLAAHSRRRRGRTPQGGLAVGRFRLARRRRVADEPEMKPWTVLREQDEATLYYAGSATVDLYRSEAARYRETSRPAPRISGS